MPTDRRRSHSRSRSPPISSHDHRRRSRSPTARSHHHHHHRHHHGRHRSHRDDAPLPPLPLVLPFKSQKLSKHDLESFRPVFASYLDIQKNKDMYDLSDDEIRGRWKSFVSKWNRGELAEGWYDPTTKAKADASFYAEDEQAQPLPPSPPKIPKRPSNSDSNDDSSDDDVGPPAPPPQHASARRGPAIPSFADLAERDEHAAADSRAAHRAARAADRATQAARLDDVLPPRAEPGTRERQLEKRRETAAAHRAFADARAAPGELADVAEGALMGGGDGDDVRTLREREQRRKTDREVRREEALRARQAEREERVAGLRDKEEKTMDMLRALARERFGGTNGGSGGTTWTDDA